MEYSTIHSLMEKRFHSKEYRNFTDIDKFDLEYMFKLYDKLVFNDEISSKLERDGDSIVFYISPAKTKKVARYGIIKSMSGTSRMYYIEISQNTLATLFKTNRSFTTTSVCSDRTGCLQLIMEINIIHLLMAIWGYLDKNPRLPDSYIYKESGPLFKCMFQRYFTHTGSTGKPRMRRSTLLRKKSSFRGYSYRGFSCYMDSLLIVIFNMIEPFWRKTIFETDTSATRYSHPFSICKKASLIKTEDQIKDLAKRIQSTLRVDYDALKNRGNRRYCTKLRIMIGECITDMVNKKGEWVYFTASEIYNLLADLYPSLKQSPIKRVNRVIIRNAAPIALSQMWDYADGSTDILWDIINTHVLVFQNGGTPPLREWNKTGRERRLNSSGFYREKSRAFGEYIINDRYRLVGVLTLDGTVPGQSGGSHYTARFKADDGLWYYYNDKNSVIYEDELPDKGVFVEKGGMKPEMLFYQKVADYQPSRKQ